MEMASPPPFAAQVETRGDNRIQDVACASLVSRSRWKGLRTRAGDSLSQVNEHEDVSEDGQKGGTVQQRCRGLVHDRVWCDQRLDEDDQHGDDQ